MGITYKSISYKDKEIIILKSIEQIADVAIAKWTEISEKAIKTKGVFTVALSGGRTPVVLYQKLSQIKSLPWDKTHIFMVDERFVPYESDENNFRMISQTLLYHLHIPAKNIHPISTSEILPEGSAAKYERVLLSCFKLLTNEPPRFDLMLLGIGEDGHTASLFPDTPALKEKSSLVVAVTLPDKAEKERITLTFPVINNTENILFLASGKNKAKSIKEVIETENSLLPAAMVKPKNGKLIFLLDQEAASLLSVADKK
jgi:6-phosphogluconolactonase